MSRKSKRSRSKKATLRKAYQTPQGTTAQRSFNAPLFILGAGFTILGLFQTFSPVLFHSQGGFGRSSQPQFTSVYNHDQSRGFGIIFCLMGIAFLYWGYCAVRNARKKPPSSNSTRTS